MFPHRNEAPETAQGAGFSLAAIFDSHRLHIHQIPEIQQRSGFPGFFMPQKSVPPGIENAVYTKKSNGNGIIDNNYQ